MASLRVNRRWEADLLKTFLDGEEIESRYICLDCIDDEWLRGRAELLPQPRPCIVCEKVVRKAQTPTKIAKIIREPLKAFFSPGACLYPGYEMTLSEIIEKSIRCRSAEVCDAIAQLLIEPDADEEAFYFEGQDYGWAPSPFESEDEQRWWIVGEWTAVAHELTHGQRFFNDKAELFFESLIFEALWSHKEEAVGQPSAIKRLPAGTSFYRARIANNLEDIKRFQEKPGIELSAPPKDRAANNRMSAAGVSLMYVSGDPRTCIAEVRPSIGDQVVVAEFKSTEELRFFDFTTLDSLEHDPISFFSPIYEKRTEHRMLLSYLHDLIARPVRRGDTDYLMTQALAESIRFSEHKFDGIAFRSVQHSAAGINFVLFDKSEFGGVGSHPQKGKPPFSLKASTEAVSVHSVSGVTYHTELSRETKRSK